MFGFLTRVTVVDLSDDFTTHLQGVNGGFLNPGNLHLFSKVAYNLKSASPVIEIGSFAGLSTNLLRYYLRKYNRTNGIFNCDKWEPRDSGDITSSGTTYEEMFQFAEDAYKRNVRQFSNPLPYTIRQWSDEFFDLWRTGAEVKDIWGRAVKLGGPISFAYIDGWHSYEACKQDFENVNEFLEKDGFILFDDSADGTIWESGRVAAEVGKRRDYELVMKNPNHLVRKIR